MSNDGGQPAGRQGFSLVEILVVLSLFAVIGILVTQGIFLSFRSSIKSESLSRVRESVDFAMSVMERQLHAANSISSCTSTGIVFVDSLGATNSFSCDNTGSTATDGSISSNSARLTSNQITVTTCSFECSLATANTLPEVVINISAKDKKSDTVGAVIDVRSKVVLRTY